LTDFHETVYEHRAPGYALMLALLYFIGMAFAMGDPPSKDFY
jgi:hypothetical protein